MNPPFSGAFLFNTPKSPTIVDFYQDCSMYAFACAFDTQAKEGL